MADRLLRPSRHKKTAHKAVFVVPLGLEPRLFCTKNRRVASYTMGQFPVKGVQM